MSNAIRYTEDSKRETLDAEALASVVGGSVDCGDGDDGGAVGDGQPPPFNPYRDPIFPPRILP